MKLYFVESGTADNYIMSVSDDGVCCDNCAPSGKFANVDLYSYDENGEKISGETIAKAIREAIKQFGCDITDIDLGGPCFDSMGAWEAHQEAQEYFNRDEAFLIADNEAEEQDEDEFRQLPSPAVDTYAEDEWRLDVVKHDDGSAEGWLYVVGAEVKMHTLTDDEETVINSFVAGEYRNQYTKEFIEEE